MDKTKEQPTRPMGPPVWMQMDQKALDDAYDQSVYASNQRQVVSRRAAANARARDRIGGGLRLQYGSADVEGIDFFKAGPGSRPLNVFVHGGAWRNNRSSDYAFIAEMFLRASAHCAIIDFSSVEDVSGDLGNLFDQVRRAVIFLYSNADELGIDRGSIYLTGHSSGAHLTSCLVTHDWTKDDMPDRLFKGALLASGMYDLRPVRLSKRSLYVKFTDAIENQLSAIRHLDRLNAPLIVAYGTEETPEFQRQARDFAASVQTANKSVSLLVADGYNHFEIIETLGNPHGLLGFAALEQMKLLEYLR